jgi:hypothetical protein
LLFCDAILYGPEAVGSSAIWISRARCSRLMRRQPNWFGSNSA